MAEERLQEPRSSHEPHLCYLDDSDAAPVAEYDRAVVAARTEEYTWLVARLTDRIAARWPDEIDPAWVQSHAVVALRRAAASVEDPEDLPTEGVRAIQERLRTLLGGTEWYREAMLARVRPLCEAWRGAVLAGREPTDRILCSRLKLSSGALSERFVELATVFAVEPAAMLPGEMELREGIAVAAGSVDPEQRLIISLYFEQCLTLAEIADVMGLLPVRAQELFGRAAAAIAGEANLSVWFTGGQRRQKSRG